MIYTNTPKFVFENADVLQEGLSHTKNPPKSFYDEIDTISEAFIHILEELPCPSNPNTTLKVGTYEYKKMKNSNEFKQSIAKYRKAIADLRSKGKNNSHTLGIAFKLVNRLDKKSLRTIADALSKVIMDRGYTVQDDSKSAIKRLIQSFSAVKLYKELDKETMMVMHFFFNAGDGVSIKFQCVNNNEKSQKALNMNESAYSEFSSIFENIELI